MHTIPTNTNTINIMFVRACICMYIYMYMLVSIDAVRATGKVAEVCICYTGKINNVRSCCLYTTLFILFHMYNITNTLSFTSALNAHIPIKCSILYYTIPYYAIGNVLTSEIYTLAYYQSVAREAVAAGAHMIGIKDMAGLLRPLEAG